MEIKFDKALLWLVPYLYLVSVLYYWGYWRELGVDAINYYPASDFITGVVNPLSGTVLFSIEIIFVVSILFYLSNRIKINKVWQYVCLIFMALLVASIVIFPSYYHMLFGNKTGQRLFLPIILNLHAAAAVVISLTIALVIDRKLKKLEPSSFEYCIRLSCIISFLLLPCLAYVDAEGQAWEVIHNKYFKYTSVRNGKLPLGIYKYLGKAGDYHFLMTVSNDKHYIVKSDDLGAIELLTYWVQDSGRVKLYSRYRQDTVKLKK